MELKEYIISVISVSFIAGILLNIVKANKAYSNFIKLLAGLCVIITVISPWKSIYFSDILYYINDWEVAADVNTEDGLKAYNEALQASIIDRTQTYILEKASLLGADLTATVTVSTEFPPTPIAVELAGSISPYSKSRLKEIIANDLGIPKEAQEWK